MADRALKEIDPEIDRLERLADLMDAAFHIPGTNIRIGLDSLIGLVPGVGDGAALLPAGYIIAKSWQLGAPKRLLAQMAFNTGVDTVIGSIPILGDIFDVGWKANRRNVALLKEHKRAAVRQT